MINIFSLSIQFTLRDILVVKRHVTIIIKEILVVCQETIVILGVEKIQIADIYKLKHANTRICSENLFAELKAIFNRDSKPSSFFPI